MKIMLVEDDLDSRESISEFLQGMGHQVWECSDGQEALHILDTQKVTLVLSDIKMPQMNGVELLKRLKPRIEQEGLVVVLITGHGDMASAIEALRAGARDYLLKPIKIEELVRIIAEIPEVAGTEKAPNQSPQGDLGQIKQAIEKITGIDQIDIYSPLMAELFQQAVKLHLDREIPVLIQGETGTGKEIIARLIHQGSEGKSAPFVDINCAAINPSLFESELFGYAAGAYTGGLAKGSQGKLDLASGGTLLLDEIGEMSLDLQAKLLRVIQEKEYYRVGGLKKVKTDVRIICATNVNLDEKVTAGEFRQDLFYRLNVGRLHLPALRDRKEEIVPIATAFLRFFAQRKQKKFQTISAAAAQILVAYHWPGNIRELRNTLEWIAFNHDHEELLPGHLQIITDKFPEAPEHLRDHQEFLTGDDFTLPRGQLSLSEHTDQIILHALQLHAGNKAQTARYLGISRRALYRRLARINDEKTS